MAVAAWQRSYWWAVAGALAASGLGMNAFDLGYVVWAVIVLMCAVGGYVSLRNERRTATRETQWDRRDRQHKYENLANHHHTTHDKLDGLASSTRPRPEPIAVSCTTQPPIHGPQTKTGTAAQTFHVVLGVTNHGPKDEFQAQVVAWGSGDSLDTKLASHLKWVRNGDEKLSIPTDMREYLHLATADYNPRDDYPSDAGELPNGVVSVLVDWESRGSLVDATHWESVEFQTRVWSLHVVITSANASTAHHQGVRLHLFRNPEDDPSGKTQRSGWGVGRPLLRVSLFHIEQEDQLAVGMTCSTPIPNMGPFGQHTRFVFLIRDLRLYNRTKRDMYVSLSWVVGKGGIVQSDPRQYHIPAGHALDCPEFTIGETLVGPDEPGELANQPIQLFVFDNMSGKRRRFRNEEFYLPPGDLRVRP